MSDSITTDAETQSVRWYSHYPIIEASAGYGLQQLYLDFLFFYAQKTYDEIWFLCSSMCNSS